jgi:hypothetical protein
MQQPRGIRPRRTNEPLQGRILQELLIESKTTSLLAHHTRENVFEVRNEIIRLHHLGVLEPVGYRTDTPRRGKTVYDRDSLWSITDHGMSHHSSHVDCWACRIRERVLLQAGRFT